MRIWTNALFVALWTVATAHTLASTVGTRVIVVSGAAAPDNNGRISQVSNPVLNDAGQVAFLANLSDTFGGSTDDLGIFRGDGLSGNLTQIAREGQDAPDKNGRFSEFQNHAINEAGQVVFESFLTDTNEGNNDDGGIYVGAGGALTQIVREGQSAPSLNASFSELILGGFNNSGQVAFVGETRRTEYDQGVFRGAGAELTQIALSGQFTPDASRRFGKFGFPSLNELGQVAFATYFTRNNDGSIGDDGVYRGSGALITQIARESQASFGGNSGIQSFGIPRLNDMGQVAFHAYFQAGPIGLGTEQAIFKGVGGPLGELVRLGDLSPDANGSFNGFSIFTMNNSGQVVFPAAFTDTNGGFEDDSGIFRDESNVLKQIVREGQSPPGGNGILRVFDSPVALNNAGQVAFNSILTDDSGGVPDEKGVYFYDDSVGLIEIARKGDRFLGSTITDLRFGNTFTSVGNEWSGLNEFGEIAYQFTLADGRQGIAVASVIPEPSALMLWSICALAIILAKCSSRIS